VSRAAGQERDLTRDIKCSSRVCVISVPSRHIHRVSLASRRIPRGTFGLHEQHADVDFAEPSAPAEEQH
jgi:hypothetical protein